MIATYRDFKVDTHARLTSANPGGTCTSASMPDSQMVVAKNSPNYANLDIAKKIAKELHCSLEQGKILLCDVSNFLWLAAQSPEVSVPSPAIDEAWHVFVLFTKEYIDFCHTYCGGYVHHAPHTGPEMRMTVQYVTPTVDLLHKLFGGKPSNNWDYVSFKDWLTTNVGSNPVAA